MFSFTQSRCFRNSLRSRVTFAGLPQVQAVFLLQVLVAVSDTLNGGAVHAEGLARGLVLDGQRRLDSLRRAAPHLTLSVEHLLRLARTDERDDDELSTEESATQALLEMCLGLVLKWLSRGNDHSHRPSSSPPSEWLASLEISLPFASLPLILPLRARSCPTLKP